MKSKPRNPRLVEAWERRLKLWAKGNMLWAKSDMLRAEGNMLWAEAVLAEYGNIKLGWQWNEETQGCDCIVNGQIYRYRKIKP